MPGCCWPPYLELFGSGQQIARGEYRVVLPVLPSADRLLYVAQAGPKLLVLLPHLPNSWGASMLDCLAVLAFESFWSRRQIEDCPQLPPLAAGKSHLGPAQQELAHLHASETIFVNLINHSLHANNP